MAYAQATAAYSNPSTLPQGEREKIEAVQRAPLDAAHIERLRMHADAGRDAGALGALLLEAHTGNVEAQRAAGEALLRRADADATKQGVACLEGAAAQGDQRAMLLLGKAWLFGVGELPSNVSTARQWFERIDAKSPHAAYYLGVIERRHTSDASSQASAMQRFRFAAERGLPEAMYLLGNGYAHGEGVEIDPREAMRWYMRAAYLDHPQALQELAYAFARGDTLLPQSDLQAANMRAAIAHALRHPKPRP